MSFRRSNICPYCKRLMDIILFPESGVVAYWCSRCNKVFKVVSRDAMVEVSEDELKQLR